MRKTSKKLIAIFLVLILSFALVVPVAAAPSSNRATAADLQVIVRGYVERHVDQFLGDNSLFDSAVAAFEVFVTDLAQTAVSEALADTEGIINLVSPIISAMLNDVINSALAELSASIPDVDVSKAVDAVLTSQIVMNALETILSLQIVNDILERTIEYAVADAIDYAMGQIVFIPAEADVLDLSRRYANEIMGFNVVPFPLSHAFLRTSLSNQGLLMGHSLDLVNPFWAIEIHSHGFLNLQRTYRVTGWQRTVNTDAIEFLVNLIPGVNLNVNDFLSIENYVLARLAVDVVGGTYDGITNFDVDAFMDALPEIIWNALKRATVDVITERIEAFIDHVIDLIETEIRRGTDWVQSEIDAVLDSVRNSMRNAANAILPVYTCVQEAIESIRARIDESVGFYFNVKEWIRDNLLNWEAARNLPVTQPVNNVRERLGELIRLW